MDIVPLKRNWGSDLLLYEPNPQSKFLWPGSPVPPVSPAGQFRHTSACLTILLPIETFLPKGLVNWLANFICFNHFCDEGSQRMHNGLQFDHRFLPRISQLFKR
jgi:hypothetical protein